MLAQHLTFGHQEVLPPGQSRGGYLVENLPVFVFDLMVRERPEADCFFAPSFLGSEVLHPADFTIKRDGVVTPNPEVVRAVAGFMGDALVG